MRAWWARVRAIVDRDRLDAELREEIEAHRQMAMEDGLDRGLSPEQARAAAQRAIGRDARIREASREAWMFVWIETLLQDLRYGLRLLRRSPGFSVVAVAVIALGLGANTAIYQLLDAVAFRPLPVAAPHELVVLELADGQRWSRRMSGYPVVSQPFWEHFRDQQDVFAGVLAWAGRDVRLDGDGGGSSARALFVSGEFFDVLGVTPVLGRALTASDGRHACETPGAVVSHGFWQRQLGGDAGAVGRRLQIHGRAVEVLGVAPPSFTGPEVGRVFDVAVPACASDVLGGERGLLRNGATGWLTVMGRRAPGRSLESVNAQLAAISPGLFEATVPSGLSGDEVDAYRRLRLHAVSGASGVSALRARYGDPLVVLLAATGLVLLVACANLASLILARASARQRELAVRQALGASRLRLVRQLIVESTVLATAGAAAGVLVAVGLSRALVRLLGDGATLDLVIDARTVLFLASTAVLACAAFGLLPAWRASRGTALDAMRASVRGAAAGEGLRLRQGLVIGQVALSLVLLFGAVLFASTLRNLLEEDSGFEAAGVLVARVDFSMTDDSPERRSAMKRQVLERLRTLPGVQAAAAVRHVPMGGTGSSLDAWSDVSVSPERVAARLNGVTDGFFDAMRIPLVAGRDFARHDEAGAPRVAIVNQSLAARLGLGGNPVGQRFRAGSAGSETLLEVVGLVPDTKHFSLREDAPPMAYVPLAHVDDPREFATLMIRTSVPLAQAAPAVRQAVAEIGPDVSADVRALDDTIQAGLLRERLMATLSSFFGVFALLIATVGLYGVLSYSVVRRTSEIGVRVALGAQRGDILRMVLGQAGVLLAAGLALGTGLAWAAGGAVQSFVFGVTPHDLAPLAVACAALAAVAFPACYLPARRAARLDPIGALREQ